MAQTLIKAAENITELIGKTPLVQLNRIDPKMKAQLIAKLEGFNPSHSVKDRTALNMIEKAESKGLITPKVTTLIEPTSGSAGIALAYICAVKGYSLVLTMPDSMSNERRMLLKAYGAEVILTPGHLGMNGAVQQALKIAQKTPNSYILNQFDNDANPEAHRNTTAEEIWADTSGEIDILVAGIGTGGTISGIAQVIKSRKPSFKAIGIEPSKSAVLSGEEAGPHGIQGIGAGFIPRTLDRASIDEIFSVNEEEAIAMARKLALKEGMLCGISSGAAVHVALQLAKMEENAGKLILVILPDFGERYLSTTLFDHLVD